jgi:hypothetical protein
MPKLVVFISTDQEHCCPPFPAVNNSLVEKRLPSGKNVKFANGQTDKILVLYTAKTSYLECLIWMTICVRMGEIYTKQGIGLCINF